jgi:hypothetical protein
MTARDEDRPSVEDVAGEAIGWMATSPAVGRIDLGNAVLIDRPLPYLWFAVATRVRFPPDATDDAIARVRAWYAGRGRPEFAWSLGPHHTPADLADRLVASGATRDPDGLTAMVLDHEPPPGPPDVEVRAVTTFEEYRIVEDITAEAFEFNAADAAAFEAASADAWAHWQTEPDRRFLLAWHDGRPIAEGGLAATTVGPLILSGGATRAAARGRGAYRALVRARWDEAVRRGAPALVVQASPMSRPILERAGFRDVGAITLLVDRAVAAT